MAHIAPHVTINKSAPLKVIPDRLTPGAACRPAQVLPDLTGLQLAAVFQS
jgi:hypothetical protein